VEVFLTHARCKCFPYSRHFASPFLLMYEMGYVTGTGIKGVDMNSDKCRHEFGQTHIHILIQMPMYVEVWNIMVCNQKIPDPNMHEVFVVVRLK